MNQIILRDYQKSTKANLRAGMRLYQKGLLIGATGFGKTEVVASIIEDSVKLGKRVIFMADRNALVHQTSQRLTKSNIRHGVIQGDNTFGRYEQVLVCSQQTLEKRGFMNQADLVILDEAHTQRKKTMAMLNALPKKTRIIGLTATPFSAGMGNFWDFSVIGASTKQLQDQGWLVPLRVYLGTEIDRSKLKYASGEYTAQSVADAGSQIIGDIVSEWAIGTNREFGGKVKTLCFVPTVAYGADIAEEFAMAGYRFKQVSYRHTAEENAESIEDLRNGNIDGLISVEALVKGMDIPDVQCIIVARKYCHSLTSHIQMLGRGMRSCPEIKKEFCLVNDHVYNYPRFEAEAEPFWKTGDWELSRNEQKRPTPLQREDAEVDAIIERTCFSCSFVLPEGTLTCPACGYTKPRKKPIDISVIPGKMRRYESGFNPIRIARLDLWPIISTIALRRKGNDTVAAEKFAKAQFKNLTGSWPPWGEKLDLDGKYDAEIDLIIDAQIKSYIKRVKKNAKRKSYA